MLFWEIFGLSQPLYQHVRVDTIQIKRRQGLMLEQRLFIDYTHQHRMWGEWNGYGRLINVTSE